MKLQNKTNHWCTKGRGIPRLAPEGAYWKVKTWIKPKQKCENQVIKEKSRWQIRKIIEKDQNYNIKLITWSFLPSKLLIIHILWWFFNDFLKNSSKSGGLCTQTPTLCPPELCPCFPHNSAPSTGQKFTLRHRSLGYLKKFSPLELFLGKLVFVIQNQDLSSYLHLQW